jgi:hypothetical protein
MCGKRHAHAYMEDRYVPQSVPLCRKYIPPLRAALRLLFAPRGRGEVLVDRLRNGCSSVAGSLDPHPCRRADCTTLLASVTPSARRPLPTHSQRRRAPFGLPWRIEKVGLWMVPTHSWGNLKSEEDGTCGGPARAQHKAGEREAAGGSHTCLSARTIPPHTHTSPRLTARTTRRRVWRTARHGREELCPGSKNDWPQR